MQTFQFFNCLTLPDISGGRYLYHLDEEIGDKEVAKIIFHHHLQERGRDASYLMPHQAQVAVAAVVEIRDFLPRLDVRYLGQQSETELLGWLFPVLDQQPTVFWDGGQGIDGLLRTRGLICQEPLPDLRLASIEEQLALAPGFMRLEQLAGRMSIGVEAADSDESRWNTYRYQGIQPLVSNCLTNLLAITEIGLRQLLLQDRLDEESYSELSEQCHSLIPTTT